FADAELAEEAFAGGARIARGDAAQCGAALRDRALVEAAPRRHRHQRCYLAAAAGLAEDRDALRIAAEGRNVVAYPLQCRDEILHTGIRCPRPFLATEIGKMQAAEDVQAVRNGYDDHVFLLRQVAAVINEVVARARGKAA